jgi:excisionase family DNA binding protein
MKALTWRDLEKLPPTLTVEEAAPLYRKSKSALYRAIKRGDVPAIRVGGSVRILTWKLLDQLGVVRASSWPEESELRSVN